MLTSLPVSWFVGYVSHLLSFGACTLALLPSIYKGFSQSIILTVAPLQALNPPLLHLAI